MMAVVRDVLPASMLGGPTPRGRGLHWALCAAGPRGPGGGSNFGFGHGCRMRGGPKCRPSFRVRRGRREEAWVRMHRVGRIWGTAGTMKIKTNGIELNYVVEG